MSQTEAGLPWLWAGGPGLHEEESPSVLLLAVRNWGCPASRDVRESGFSDRSDQGWIRSCVLRIADQRVPLVSRFSKRGFVGIENQSSDHRKDPCLERRETSGTRREVERCLGQASASQQAELLRLHSAWARARKQAFLHSSARASSSRSATTSEVFSNGARSSQSREPSPGSFGISRTPGRNCHYASWSLLRSVLLHRQCSFV